MTYKRHNMDWVFWFQWIVATSVGWALAAGGRAIFLPSSNDNFWDAIYRSIAFISVMLFSGILVGLAQWLILQRRLPHSRWWIAATFIGTVAESIVFLVEGAQGSESPWANSLVKALVVGASVGIAQSYGLRVHQVRRAGWWILASTVGYFATLVASSAFGVNSVAGYWINVTLQGVMVGVITGLAMIWLLREPVTETQVVHGNAHRTTPWPLSATFGAVAGFAVILLPLGLAMLFLFYIASYDCGYSRVSCDSDISGIIGFPVSAVVGGLIGGWRRHRSNHTDQSVFRGGMIGGIVGEGLYALAYSVALFMSL